MKDLYSPTRWWSRWECAKQVMELWRDVRAFITRIDVDVSQIKIKNYKPCFRYQVMNYLLN